MVRPGPPPGAPPGRIALWVVVPAHDEERWLGATLAALAAQRDSDFTVLVVDNASTDGTGAVAASFAAAHPSLDLRVLHESRKGTGTASDAGFRHAIANGATHVARTDADCLPRPDWTAAIRRAFAEGWQLLAGRLVPRTDDFRVRLPERVLLPGVVAAAAGFGRLRKANRDPKYLTHYTMCAGANVAVEAALYEACGGFPHSAIEDLHEDRALINAARERTAAITHRRDMVVEQSLRRVRAHGLGHTLLWYYDHRARPAVVDVR